MSGDEHQLGRAARDDAIEAGEQAPYLPYATIQFLRDEQPARRVVLAEWEFVNSASRFPFSKAAPQITLDTGCGLVALLGSLGEQFHDDRRDWSRDIFYPLARRRRLPRDVAVNPFHRVGR